MNELTNALSGTAVLFGVGGILTLAVWSDEFPPARIAGGVALGIAAAAAVTAMWLPVFV